MIKFYRIISAGAARIAFCCYASLFLPTSFATLSHADDTFVIGTSIHPNEIAICRGLGMQSVRCRPDIIERTQEFDGFKIYWNVHFGPDKYDYTYATIIGGPAGLNHQKYPHPRVWVNDSGELVAFADEYPIRSISFVRSDGMVKEFADSDWYWRTFQISANGKAFAVSTSEIPRFGNSDTVVGYISDPTSYALVKDLHYDRVYSVGEEIVVFGRGNEEKWHGCRPGSTMVRLGLVDGVLKVKERKKLFTHFRNRFYLRIGKCVDVLDYDPVSNKVLLRDGSFELLPHLQENIVLDMDDDSYELVDCKPRGSTGSFQFLKKPLSEVLQAPTEDKGPLFKVLREAFTETCLR